MLASLFLAETDNAEFTRDHEDPRNPAPPIPSPATCVHHVHVIRNRFTIISLKGLSLLCAGRPQGLARENCIKYQ